MNNEVAFSADTIFFPTVHMEKIKEKHFSVRFGFLLIASDLITFHILF